MAGWIIHAPARAVEVAPREDPSFPGDREMSRAEVPRSRAARPAVPSIMQIDLSTDDARFLHQLLARHLEEMENELVHTDKRAMQREIAADARRLRDLLARLPG